MKLQSSWSLKTVFVNISLKNVQAAKYVQYVLYCLTQQCWWAFYIKCNTFLRLQYVPNLKINMNKTELSYFFLILFEFPISKLSWHNYFCLDSIVLLDCIRLISNLSLLITVCQKIKHLLANTQQLVE